MSRRYSTGQEQLFQNLTRDLSDLVDNEELLHRSVGNFLNNLIDELTLGIIFDQHRKFKTDSYDLTVDMSEIAKEDQKIHYSGNLFNIVVCPVCAKPLRIAENVRVHLAQCMKIPRPTTRSSNRQQRSDGREQSNSSYMHTYSDAHSENEGSEDGKDSDPDWSEKGKRNKGKKNKGLILFVSTFVNIKHMFFRNFFGIWIKKIFTEKTNTET